MGEPVQFNPVGWTAEQWDAVRQYDAFLGTTSVPRLRDAILDIDAHASPFSADDDGFVTGGYLVSVGAVHRALGIVGHCAAKCKRCTPESHDCIPADRHEQLLEAVRPHVRGLSQIRGGDEAMAEGIVRSVERVLEARE